MWYRKLIFLGFVPVFFTLAYSCSFFAGGDQRRGRAVETWQIENKTFRVRVTAYEEKGANVNGAYYVFESAAVGSNDWRQIVTFRHDDQPKIPADQVKFVNDQIGYLFMGWVYAVSTDGGVNWLVWDASRDLPNWQCCNYGLIRAVNISENGSGVMRLNSIQDRLGEVPQLRTDDYGRHWRAD